MIESVGFSLKRFSLGFHVDWVELVMRCISSVSYSILINWRVQGLFHPIGGLRHGDLLPPYLFLFCSKSLSSILKKRVLEGKLHGIRVVARGPKVSHLLFADNSVLLYQSHYRGVPHRTGSLKDL